MEPPCLRKELVLCGLGEDLSCTLTPDPVRVIEGLSLDDPVRVIEGLSLDIDALFINIANLTSRDACIPEHA